MPTRLMLHPQQIRPPAPAAKHRATVPLYWRRTSFAVPRRRQKCYRPGCRPDRRRSLPPEARRAARGRQRRVAGRLGPSGTVAHPATGRVIDRQMHTGDPSREPTRCCTVAIRAVGCGRRAGDRQVGPAHPAAHHRKIFVPVGRRHDRRHPHRSLCRSVRRPRPCCFRSAARRLRGRRQRGSIPRPAETDRCLIRSRRSPGRGPRWA